MPKTVLLKKLFAYDRASATSITRAIARGEPFAKFRAKSFGTYLSSSIASWMRFFVSSEIVPLLFKTRETVETDTPAALATSLIVTAIYTSKQTVALINRVDKTISVNIYLHIAQLFVLLLYNIEIY